MKFRGIEKSRITDVKDKAITYHLFYDILGYVSIVNLHHFTLTNRLDADPVASYLLLQQMCTDMPVSRKRD